MSNNNKNLILFLSNFFLKSKIANFDKKVVFKHLSIKISTLYKKINNWIKYVLFKKIQLKHQD